MFKQPEYDHPSLMHVVQLLTRPDSLQSISQYGTQNKEAKNQKNNDYLSTVARMNDLEAALEDVYTRESHSSSVKIRRCGETKPISHCSKCGKVGHKADRCNGSGSRTFKQKFVDMDLLDPLYKIRDQDMDSTRYDLSSGEEEENDDDNVIATPKKSVHFDDEDNIQLYFENDCLDSPAKRTRSRNRNVARKVLFED